MQLVDSREAANRIRAAIAYSAKEHAEIAEISGVPVHTIRRIVSTKNPRGADLEELWLLADACGVPRWFVENGYALPEQDADDDTAEWIAAAKHWFREPKHLAERLMHIELALNQIKSAVPIEEHDAAWVTAQIEREIAGEDRPVSGRADSSDAGTPHLRRVDPEG